MIHNVAMSAAAKSKVPFDPSAVVALEEALEPMLEALTAAAFERATAQGRADFTEEDLKAVSKTFMKA
jgi:histone H3/H4